MGEELLNLCQAKLKREHKLAFAFTFFVALLIHLYKFTNTLPNHDSVFNYYSDQNVLGSGRWALSLACGLSSYYDLPWINGLVSCLFLALTVTVVVSLFSIKNPVLIGLTGGLMAASPSTTQTFFFLYTADGYMIAMLLAALAVYFSRIDEIRPSRWFLSILCVCVCCGIYQAYVSFALVLAVCYFIDDLLQNNHNRQQCFRWVLRQMVIYTVSLAAYYAIWKLCMRISCTTANDYQGISEVGKLTTGLVLNGLINSIKTTVFYFLQWNVLEHGFTSYSVLCILFLVLTAIGFVIAVKNSGLMKRKWALPLVVLCLIAIIPFACIWHFTSYTVGYRVMMLQSMTLLFVLSALFYERWAKAAAKNIMAILLVTVIFNNTLMANISYFYLNQCYERSFAEGAEMMAEIHDLQDTCQFDKIAVLGSSIHQLSYENFDPETGAKQVSGSIHLLNEGLLEKSLLFDGSHTVAFLKETFGLALEAVDSSQADILFRMEQVQAMACWPSDDAMAVIDGILVIKLSNIQSSG